MNEKQARRIVRLRSEGDCEVRIQDVCLGRATNFQHRKNRSQGGLYLPSHGIDVCGSGTTGCHGWIHANPAESYANGWSVKSTQDPATVPFKHWLHGWVLPDDDGDFDYPKAGAA
ncbi:HNH endonuclease [Amycolatopsis sp. WAC 04182]|uniref:HNH endonuclease n=1 Tax=Amycolatopsis sp. WAC 04182 TaxID=2203198 RepID=UPI000F7A52DD|nr:HNH endonuclease [Amycolatopsis sp. WAC 04182]RSN65449.1 HNH endonuclease [Amycolatopsis sp. WAC 04182]